MSVDVFTVLFVCSGNTCRSPLAERLFAHAAATGGVAARALSAGTHAAGGQPASMNAVLAGVEMGVDLSEHRSRPLTRELVHAADLVLVMERRHHEDVLRIVPDASERTYLVTAFAARDAGEREVGDPIGAELPAYRATARELEIEIRRIMPEIRRRAGAEKTPRPAAGPEVPGPGRSS